MRRKRTTKLIVGIMSLVLVASVPMSNLNAKASSRNIMVPAVGTDLSNDNKKYLEKLSKTIVEKDFRTYDVTIEATPFISEDVEYGPLDVVLAIDRSASISVNDMQSIEGAAQIFATNILESGDDNQVGIVSYATNKVEGSSTELLDISGIATIKAALDNKGTVTRDSATNIQGAIMASKATLGIKDYDFWEPEANNNRRKIIILLTDGEANYRYSDVWEETFDFHDSPDWWHAEPEEDFVLEYNGQSLGPVRLPKMADYNMQMQAALNLEKGQDLPPGMAKDDMLARWWSNAAYKYYFAPETKRSITYLANHENVYGKQFGQSTTYLNGLRNFREDTALTTFEGLSIENQENEFEIGQKRWSYLGNDNKKVGINGKNLDWQTFDRDDGANPGNQLTINGLGKDSGNNVEMIKQATILEGQYAVAQGIDLYTIYYEGNGANAGNVDFLKQLTLKMENPPESFDVDGVIDPGTPRHDDGDGGDDGTTFTRAFSVRDDLDNIYELLAKQLTSRADYKVEEKLNPDFEFVLDANGKLPASEYGTVKLAGDSFVWTFVDSDRKIATDEVTYTYKVRVKDTASPLKYEQGHVFASVNSKVPSDSLSVTTVKYKKIEDSVFGDEIVFMSPRTTVKSLVSVDASAINPTNKNSVTSINLDTVVNLKGTIPAKNAEGSRKYSYKWYEEVGGKFVPVANMSASDVDYKAETAPFSLYDETKQPITPGTGKKVGDTVTYRLEVKDEAAASAGYTNGIVVQKDVALKIVAVDAPSPMTSPTAKPSEGGGNKPDTSPTPTPTPISQSVNRPNTRPVEGPEDEIVDLEPNELPGGVAVLPGNGAAVAIPENPSNEMASPVDLSKKENPTTAGNSGYITNLLVALSFMIVMSTFINRQVKKRRKQTR